MEHDDELLGKYLAGEELSLRRDPAGHPEGDDLRLDRAGAVRRLLQEQGRAGPARRGDRLPAESRWTSRRSRATSRCTTTPTSSAAHRTRSRSRALAFKVATDPYVGRLTFFRVYSGSLKSGQLRLQQHQGQAGADRPAAPDARQQAGRDRGSARRRHRRGHRPQGDPHRRYPVRRGQADHPGGDEVPQPGHRRRHRAQDQGRPGQALHRPPEAPGRGPDLPGALRRRDRPDDHRRHGRAAPRDPRGPHEARVQGRGQRRQAPGGIPRDDPEEGHRRRGQVHPPDRAARASTATW